MAVNISLEARREVEASQQPIARNFVGYDASASDGQLWNANRGAWALPTNLAEQRFATLSHDGTVRVVAELEGVENVDDQGRRVQALLGRVLHPGDPVRDALVGQPAPSAPGVTLVDTSELDAITPAERYAASERSRRTFLLLLNPEEWFWSPEDETDVIRRTAAGISVRESWVVGGRKQGIEPGDRVYLLQTGAGRRGVRGHGTVSSQVFQAEHPDDPTRQANFVDVDWQLVLAADEMVDMETLRAQVPGYSWNPPKPGVELHQPMADQMDALWHARPEHRPEGITEPDQGWELVDARRRAARDEALRRLEEGFVADGWEVSQTNGDRPYGAVATRGDQVRYLYGRAAETAGRPVVFSAAEKAHAVAHHAECVLGVLTDATFSGTTLEGDSGTLTVLPMVSDDSGFEPALYTFTPEL